MKITKRTITESEFLKLKKQKPFSVYRQDAKAINFQKLFNASYPRFSESVLEVAWNQERVDDFIRDNNLYDDLADMKETWQDRGIDPKLYSYYTVSKFIHDKFFETYPGLMKRITRNIELGKRDGYLRSFHGGIRRVPLLALSYDSETGKTRKHEDKKELANWKNIMANTTIQTDESVTINSCIADWDDPRGILVGTVHDSVTAYVERAYAHEVLPKLKTHFERVNVEWQGKMIWPTDTEVYDLTNPDHYYKHGVDASEFLKGVKHA